MIGRHFRRNLAASLLTRALVRQAFRGARLALVVASVAICAVALGAGASAHDAAPGGHILFVVSRFSPPAARMYVLSTDARSRHRITTGATDPEVASWSPDGGRIAFIAYNGSARGPGAVVAMKADGSQRQRLARESPARGGNISYAWSPTGKRLAYAITEGDRPHLFISDLVAGRRVELKPPERAFPTSGYSDVTWSPNGRWIGFLRSVGDPTTPAGGCCALDYELIHPNGTGLRRLLHIYEIAHDYPYVTWAPNGRSVAVVTDGRDPHDPLLGVVSVRTGRVRRIRGFFVSSKSGFSPFSGAPIWSPNSERLALAVLSWSSKHHEDLLVSVRRDGTGLRILLRGQAYARPAQFAPDGKSLAIVIGNKHAANLERIAASGGPAQLIARAPRGWDITSLSWRR